MARPNWPHRWPSEDDCISKVHQLLETLHACPEPAHQEQETARTVAAFLESHGMHVETGFGGHGLLVTLGNGPYRLLRADLDALPHGDGARHGCGHDGHMAMLAGAMAHMHAEGVEGVAALFQPAEENGAGMAMCLADPRMAELDVRSAFAIHNIPGLELGTLEIGPGALASVGLRATLTGVEAHAASPQTGQSPWPDAHKLADQIADLAQGMGPDALATLIHVRLGRENFGTSPGAAIVAATLRGADDDVAVMRQAWRAAPTDVQASWDEVDPFPATNNTEAGNDLGRRAAEAVGMRVQRRERPYPWSEDFGHAVAKWGGALFGLGSGVDQPALHDDAYRFPAELLDQGVRFWCALGGLP
ncbi:MAG: M20/M25/M40 family metallo-hydrolase [Thermoplasmatota archaeon]